jgi:hypothetical protein
MDGKGLCGILRKLPLPDAGGRTSSVKTWLLLYTDAKLDIYIFYIQRAGEQLGKMANLTSLCPINAASRRTFFNLFA